MCTLVLRRCVADTAARTGGGGRGAGRFRDRPPPPPPPPGGDTPTPHGPPHGPPPPRRLGHPATHIGPPDGRTLRWWPTPPPCPNGCCSADRSGRTDSSTPSCPSGSRCRSSLPTRSPAWPTRRTRSC